MMPTLTSTASHDRFATSEAPGGPRFGTLVLDVDSTCRASKASTGWPRDAVTSSRAASRISRKQAMQGGGAARAGLRNVAWPRFARGAKKSTRCRARTSTPSRRAPSKRSRAFRRTGVQVVLVSGGIRHALLRLALHLGTRPRRSARRPRALRRARRLHRLRRVVAAHDRRRQDAAVSRSSSSTGPILAVGDGATDLGMRDVVDSFVAFTGFVTREPVVSQADFTIDSFAELEPSSCPESQRIPSPLASRG